MFSGMNAPRWFYPLVGICALVTTLTVVWYVIAQRNTGRWVPIPMEGVVKILDSRTGVACLARVRDPSQSFCLTSPADAKIQHDTLW